MGNIGADINSTIQLSAKKIFSIVTIVTFLVFMVEAILHYNMGRKEEDKDNKLDRFFPPPKELGKIAFVVLVASIINGWVVNKATKWAHKRHLS